MITPPPPDDFFLCASALLCVLDEAGFIQQANPAWEIKLNVVTTDLIQSAYLTWVHPNDISLTHYHLTQLGVLLGADVAQRTTLSAGQVTFANRWRDCAGHYHWLNWEISAVPQQRKFYAVATDITAQKHAEKILRDTEERFELAIQGSRHGLWDWQLKANTIYFSPQLKNMLGYQADEIEDHPNTWLKLIHPEDFTPIWAAIEAYLDKQTTRYESIYRVRHKRGDYLWILAQASARWDAQGQPYRLVGIWTDITQRQLTKQALQENEALLSAIFEVTKIGLCITDEQGCFVRVNRAYCDLFGYQPEELLGYPLTKVLPPDHHAQALKLHHAFLEGDPKVDSEGEWHLQNRCGEWLDINFTMGLLTQQTGQRLRVTTITDITKRKHLERERNRLFNLSVDMQSILGFNLTFKEVNAAWKHILGWSKAELLEKSPMELVHPDDRQAAFTRLQQLSEGVTISGFETRYLCKNGAYKWLSWNIYPLVDQQTMYVITRDITEKKQAEEEIKRQRAFVRLVVDSVPHLIFIKDKAGNFLFFNQSLAHLLGISIKGENDIVLAEVVQDSKWIKDACSKAEIHVIEHQQEVALEETCCNTEGEQRCFHMVKRPFLQNNGEIAVLSVGTDITERKRHEEALKRSEARYRAIVQDQIDLVCRYLPDGTLTFVNQAYCRYFSRREAELLNHSFMPLIPEEEQVAFQKKLKQLTPEKPVMMCEHRVVMSNGDLRWQQWFDRAMFDVEGGIIEYQGVGRDITERKQAEEALRQSEERLRMVTNAAPVILFALDAEGLFTFARGKALNVINLADDAVIGKSVFETFAQFPKELEYIRRALAGETVTTLMTYPHVVLETKFTPLVDNYQQVSGVIGVSVDMTARHHLELKLKDTVAELETILDNSVIGIAYVKEGVFARVNRKLEMLLEVGPDELEGLPFSVIYPADEDYHQIEQEVYTCLVRGQGYDADHVIRARSNRCFWSRLVGKAVDPRDLDKGVIWMIEDITTQKRAEQDLRLTATVFETTVDGIFVTDLNNKIMRVNPAFSKITGYTAEEVYGRKTSCLASGRHDEQFYQEMWHSINTTGHWQGEIWNRKKTGEVYVAWLSISAITSEKGHAMQYMAVLTDISCLQEDIENVRYLANYDSLTQLPNRLSFHDSLLRAQAGAQRHDNSFALLFIDLDGFKPVNDNLGHATGDRLLQGVAQCLQRCVRETDMVARLGGDEFTVILKNIRKQQDAARVAHDIIRCLQTPFHFNEHRVTISASIGIAIYPYDSDDIDTLLKCADNAMYKAKEAGKGCLRFYVKEKGE